MAKPLTNPDLPEPSFLVSLAGLGQEFGLKLELDGMDDSPVTPETLLLRDQGEQFGPWKPDMAQIQQKDWSGGRGNDRFYENRTEFRTSRAIWSVLNQKIMLAPQWKMSKGLRNSNYELPGDMTWQPLISTKRYWAISIDVDTTDDYDRIYFWLKKHNEPGNLTVSIQDDDGSGDPDGVANQTITIEKDDVEDIVSVFQLFDWSGTETFTNGTVKWLVFETLLSDNRGSNWQIGIDPSGGGDDVSSDGSTWNVADGGAYYYLVEPDNTRTYIPFDYRAAMYLVTQKDGEASKVFMNGWRGKATAGTSTTLTDTNLSGLAADQAIGSFIRIIDGTGDGQIRKITDNTTTVLTVATWDITPDTTSVYVIYKTDQWTEVGSTGLTAKVTDVCIFNDIVLFAQGPDTVIRRMRYDESNSPPSHEFENDTANYGNNTADFLINFQNKLFKAIAGTSQVGMAYYAEIPLGYDHAFKWTQSAAEAKEYRLEKASGGNPDINTKPDEVIIDGEFAREGTMGSLEVREWDWGDNDTLGYSTIYVRISGDADPDTEGRDYIVYQPAEMWTTGLNFMYGTYLGSSAYKITNMIDYDGNLVVFKEDGIWGNVEYIGRTDTLDYEPQEIHTNLKSAPLPTNGQAVAYLDDFLYYSWSFSLQEQFGLGLGDSAAIHDRGLWQGVGLVSNMRGYFAALCPAYTMLSAAHDGGDDNYSSVFLWNKRGWHNLFRGWGTGERVKSLFWQGSPGTNPRFWIQVGDDMSYMDFPYQSMNPDEDPDVVFQHEGVLVQSTLDLNAFSLSKYWKDMEVISKNLSVDVTLSIDYQIDEDVGTTDWKQVGTLFRSPSDIIDLNLGNTKKIATRLRLDTKDSKITPVIQGVVWNGYARIPSKRRWLLRCPVGSAFMNTDGTRTIDPLEFTEWLNEVIDNAHGVTMYSAFRELHNKGVILEPYIPKRESRNEDGSWSGYISIVAREQ